MTTGLVERHQSQNSSPRPREQSRQLCVRSPHSVQTNIGTYSSLDCSSAEADIWLGCRKSASTNDIDVSGLTECELLTPMIGLSSSLSIPLFRLCGMATSSEMEFLRGSSFHRTVSLCTGSGERWNSTNVLQAGIDSGVSGVQQVASVGDWSSATTALDVCNLESLNLRATEAEHESCFFSWNNAATCRDGKSEFISSASVSLSCVHSSEQCGVFNDAPCRSSVLLSL